MISEKRSDQSFIWDSSGADEKEKMEYLWELELKRSGQMWRYK